MEIEGGSALVSGGASGLGRAVVEALLGAGARVAILDLPSSEGESLASAMGESAMFLPADVTSEEQVEEAIAGAERSLGSLRVAVNCAGIGWAGRVVGRSGEPHPIEPFETVVRVNLIGTFNVTRLAAAAMMRHEPEGEERGVIVNTASIAAFDGQIGQSAYSASKGGVVAMTLPLARDLAAARIRVVTIAPGTFDTPMLALLPEQAKETLASGIPHPSRLGRPAEFAGLVLHVVSNPMLNGEVIRLDGALRMPPK